MRWKKVPLTAVLLPLFFLFLLFLPTTASRSLRAFFAARLAPLWEATSWSSKTREKELEEQIKRLELENSRLRHNPAAPFKIASAEVIFRSHADWQSFLWLNIGEETAPFPLKNAPVLSGDVVVGAIEEVGKHESRVRLITDPQLNPSVRVLREGRWLAKGELNGAFKSHLKGSGFNYDFPDADGPAQELRSDIIKSGDLLVTTGLDGLFPKGLKVARVTRVLPLKEGDFYYDIEAESLATSLNSLERLYLLPPQR